MATNNKKLMFVRMMEEVLPSNLEMVSLDASEQDGSEAFRIFVPIENTEYSPCLVHINYKSVDEKLHKFLTDWLNNDCILPIVVATNGNKAATAIKVAQVLKDEGLDSAFHSILSVANPQQGFLQGYSSRWDNLPFTLEEQLAAVTCFGKYSNVANCFAEALGTIFDDKPVVSTHLFGGDSDKRTLLEFVDILSQPQTGYSYKSSMKIGSFKRPDLGRTDKKVVCACCGKDIKPLRWFAQIQGKLCPVCVGKMKAMKGGISILNWYRVGFELKHERMQTHTANILNMWDERPKCSYCGNKEVVDCGNHEFLCKKCGNITLYKYGYYFIKRLNLGQIWVDKIDKSRRRLVGSWPIASSSEAVVCDNCTKLAVDFKVISDTSTNSKQHLCVPCFKKLSKKGFCK